VGSNPTPAAAFRTVTGSDLDSPDTLAPLKTADDRTDPLPIGTRRPFALRRIYNRIEADIE
jgi:hypothetical protein